MAARQGHGRLRSAPRSVSDRAARAWSPRLRRGTQHRCPSRLLELGVLVVGRGHRLCPAVEQKREGRLAIHDEPDFPPRIRAVLQDALDARVLFSHRPERVIEWGSGGSGGSSMPGEDLVVLLVGHVPLARSERQDASPAEPDRHASHNCLSIWSFWSSGGCRASSEISWAGAFRRAGGSAPAMPSQMPELLALSIEGPDSRSGVAGSVRRGDRRECRGRLGTVARTAHEHGCMTRGFMVRDGVVS